ncbi:MAG: hypothetical protein CL532_08845 [Aestuariivita sp.]|nr:hypothetical protein [Aestuariivita sp.]
MIRNLTINGSPILITRADAIRVGGFVDNYAAIFLIDLDIWQFTVLRVAISLLNNIFRSFLALGLRHKVGIGPH